MAQQAAQADACIGSACPPPHTHSPWECLEWAQTCLRTCYRKGTLSFGWWAASIVFVLERDITSFLKADLCSTVLRRGLAPEWSGPRVFGVSSKTM